MKVIDSSQPILGTVTFIVQDKPLMMSYVVRYDETDIIDVRENLWEGTVVEGTIALMAQAAVAAFLAVKLFKS